MPSSSRGKKCQKSISRLRLVSPVAFQGYLLLVFSDQNKHMCVTSAEYKSLMCRILYVASNFPKNNDNICSMTGNYWEALPVLPVPQPPPPPGETQLVPSENGGAPYLQSNIPIVHSLCRCVRVCVYCVCVLKANLMQIWLQIE